MLHTIKMIKEYYPEEKNHRVAVVSPCLAKRREFDETGIGNYNVTLNSVSEYLAKRNIDLDKFPEEKFDNPPAERAVLFSSPGGLLETAKREISEIEETTAKMREIHRINLEVARSLTENLVDLDEANDDVSEMAEQLFRLIQKQEESFAIIVENSTSTLDVIEQINPLLATINDIADRTKMLSLNASIEAIRSRHDKNYLLTVIGVLSVFSKVMLIDEALLQRGCL
jgi:hypothetical protein